jgi:hypothetical protein
MRVCTMAGGGRRGDEEILSHAYLKSIDLIELQARGVAPPYTPKVSGPEDTSNFETVVVEEGSFLSEEDESPVKLSNEEKKLNEAFSRV